MAQIKIPYLKLNNGKLIPQIGLGTWMSKDGEVQEAVKIAINSGYRHIDCALIYGNENEVGEGLKAKLSDGTIKREDMFITSKLWNTFHSRDEAKITIRQSLKNLGLNYLDLYLIHWPHGYQEKNGLFPKDGDKFLYSEIDYLETWKAMEEMVDEGLVKSIGLSNFNSQQINRVLANARIKPTVLEIECHPLLNQQKLIDLCTRNDIRVIAYSPLGSPQRPWAKAGDLPIMSEPIVNEIATALKKSAAQVLIRYQFQRGVIIIPKSVTESRIKSNFDIMDFELSNQQMEQINSMNTNHRFVELAWINDHPHYPFKIEY